MATGRYISGIGIIAFCDMDIVPQAEDTDRSGQQVRRPYGRYQYGKTKSDDGLYT
jgi:hypothetical protein